MRSTAEYPWDRLCDALNGAGVPSVDQAITRLRLMPLVDALRQTLSPETLTAFRTASATPTPAASVPPERQPDAHAATHSAEHLAHKPARKAKKASKAVVEALKHHELEAAHSVSASPNGTSAHAPQSDPSLAAFIASRDRLKTRLHELMPELTLPEAAPADRLEPLAAAALALPGLRTGQPDSPWLPSTHSSECTWAPVLAYVALRSLLGVDEPLALFDRLNLRAPLAEAFQVSGLPGQDGWRAAALVRLLFTPSASVESVGTTAFWAEPDARWLAGTNEHSGQTFINKECFEQLLGWLTVPALLASARPDLKPAATPAREQAESASQALLAEMTKAGYDLDRFLKKADPEPAEALAEATA